MQSSKPALVSLLDRAAAGRRPLIDDAGVSACRLFHGASEGIPGLYIDRFGDVLIVQLHIGILKQEPELLREAIESLHIRLGTRAVYRKFFVKDRGQTPAQVDAAHRDPVPWIGEQVQEEFPIVEHGLQFLVRPYDGFSVGLFLEHRENRRRVRDLAGGKRVLNTFAYTCGFSVSAAAGGALSVVSVDLSRRYLEWGKRNFLVNGLQVDDRSFFCSDLFDFYKRAHRQGRRFDLVILDPPTFSKTRRPQRTFQLEKQLAALCEETLELLDPGGIVLLAANHRQLSRDHLEAALTAAAGGRSCKVMARPALPLDFPGDPEYSKTVLAKFD